MENLLDENLPKKLKADFGLAVPPTTTVPEWLAVTSQASDGSNL